MPNMFELFNRVALDPKTGCWLWRGATNNSGYGVVIYRGKRWATHRLSWALHNRRHPGKLHVLHSCDTPPCCNPEHLSLGTQLDNVNDCIAKGRRSVNRNCGPVNSQTKLDAIKVRAIRRSRTSLRALGRNYGVDQATIRAVKTGRTWGWVV